MKYVSFQYVDDDLTNSDDMSFFDNEFETWVKHNLCDYKPSLAGRSKWWLSLSKVDQFLNNDETNKNIIVKLRVLITEMNITSTLEQT